MVHFAQLTITTEGSTVVVGFNNVSLMGCVGGLKMENGNTQNCKSLTSLTQNRLLKCSW